MPKARVQCTFVGVDEKRCEKTYNNGRAMRRHLKSAHSTNRIQCTFTDDDGLRCTTTFQEARNDSLLDHLEKVHGPPPSLQCTWVDETGERCKDVFKYQTSADRHLRTVHSDERPYVCDFMLGDNNDVPCGKAFKENSLLQRHYKSHLDYALRPHPCPDEDCHYRDWNKDTLQMHIRAKHPAEDGSDEAARQMDLERMRASRAVQKQKIEARALMTMRADDAVLLERLDKLMDVVVSKYGQVSASAIFVSGNLKDGKVRTTARAILDFLRTELQNAGYEPTPITYFVRIVYDENKKENGKGSQFALPYSMLQYIVDKGRVSYTELQQKFERSGMSVRKACLRYAEVLEEYTGKTYARLLHDGEKYTSTMATDIINNSSHGESDEDDGEDYAMLSDTSS